MQTENFRQPERLFAPSPDTAASNRNVLTVQCARAPNGNPEIIAGSCSLYPPRRGGAPLQGRRAQRYAVRQGMTAREHGAAPLTPAKGLTASAGPLPLP